MINAFLITRPQKPRDISYMRHKLRLYAVQETPIKTWAIPNPLLIRNIISTPLRIPVPAAHPLPPLVP